MIKLDLPKPGEVWWWGRLGEDAIGSLTTGKEDRDFPGVRENCTFPNIVPVKENEFLKGMSVWWPVSTEH